MQNRIAVVFIEIIVKIFLCSHKFLNKFFFLTLMKFGFK